MIDYVFENIHRIKIPLPENPLRETNSYLVHGPERNLLIDTGFNRDECREALDQAMRELGITADNTDLFITHPHVDHMGLAGYLREKGMRVFGSNAAARFLTTHKSALDYQTVVIQSGLEQMGVAPDDTSIHPGLKYRPALIDKVEILGDQDRLHVGDMQFVCIDTSGHCLGHLCLYEPQLRILFSGDHILAGITPNNTKFENPWDSNTDSLGLYFQNLDKIAALPVDLVLPGHRNIITDCNQRIDELKEHHAQRLASILDILGEKSLTAAEVAKAMSWDIRISRWEDFPTSQKYFATGEALSHLEHHIFQGAVQKQLVDGVVYYSRIQN